MFQELSRYLSTYKQVSIPEVGSIELVYQSASFDVANKIILPPSYQFHYSHSDAVKEHQLYFLATGLNTDIISVQQQLQNFGKDLERRIQTEAFFWSGIGKLEKRDTRIFFQPDAYLNEGLQPITAQRVIRENVVHKVLVGEQEVQKGHLPEEANETIQKRSYVSIIGWLLVLLAVAFIVFMLYKENFQTTASGNRTKIVPSKVAPLSK